ncbi:MAG: ABC transporter permease [Halobacteriota archaeon]
MTTKTGDMISIAGAMCGLIALWEITALALDGVLAFAGPLDTARAMWIYKGPIVLATWQTLLSSAVAFALAMVTGAFFVGIAVFIPVTRQPILATMTVFRSAPIIVLAPTIYSLSNADGVITRYVLGALVAVFPLAVVPIERAARVPIDFIATARVHGASTMEIHRHLELPWSLSGFLESMRMGATLAIIGVVVSEMVYPSGLGRIMQEAMAGYRTAIIFAGLVSLSIGAFIWSSIVSAVANWLQSRYFSG